MADDSREEAAAQADVLRTPRAGPTIELDAEAITAPAPERAGPADAVDAAQQADAPERDGPAEEPPPQAVAPDLPVAGEPPLVTPPPSPPSVPRPVSPWVIAPLAGAVASALVIGVGWMLGWPQVGPPAPPQTPAVTAAGIDTLSARLAGVEAKLSRPVAPAIDPALAGRVDGLDTSLAALRGEIANVGARTGELAKIVGDLRAAPPHAGETVDLSPINDRIAQLEAAVRAQGDAIAQETEKIAGIKAPDDRPLRRAMEASLLDAAVRHGDPYDSVLAAATALSPDPDALTPLERFAATGLPSPPMLSRELLNLVPKFSPAPQEPATADAGLIERLEAGASKLVRIERTDAVGNDRAAVVARATAAALRNDSAEARRELNTLLPGDRAPAQAWLDKMDARDAALAASRQYADQAMAALAKPGQ